MINDVDVDQICRHILETRKLENCSKFDNLQSIKLKTNICFMFLYKILTTVILLSFSAFPLFLSAFPSCGGNISSQLSSCQKHIMEESGYSDDKTRFVCSDHGGEAFLVFRDMRDKGEGVDCCLVGEDGGPGLACHKLVLSAVSPYFRAMFRTDSQVGLGGGDR